MFLAKFDPFKEFENMQSAFYNFPKTKAANDESITAFMPKVNTREDDKAYYLDIDLPGVKKEEITIDVDEGVFSIYGERNFKDEVKEEDYYKVETYFGKFQRVFNLPENVDSEKIEAKSENGVLEIVIPKSKNEKAKKQIKIK
jgi:HSP20 family protein